jgi:hypothetical protein
MNLMIKIKGQVGVGTDAFLHFDRRLGGVKRKTVRRP